MVSENLKKLCKTISGYKYIKFQANYKSCNLTVGFSVFNREFDNFCKAYRKIFYQRFLHFRKKGGNVKDYLTKEQIKEYDDAFK